MGDGGRSEDDGGKREEPNELSEEVGEGVVSLDTSDFESTSRARGLPTGTMSRSHSSSSWEGHFDMEVFR